MFLADWSYGVIYAVHLNEDGASYKGEHEWFCSAPALQVADMVVNPTDGALYFVVGGRRTQSGLYRVIYKGDQSTEPAAAKPVNELVKLRRELEGLHADGATDAVATALKHLGHDDRFYSLRCTDCD